MGLGDGALAWGIAGKWLDDRIKKAQQAKSHDLGFVVRNILRKFLAVNDFELLNCLPAQLFWCFHAFDIRRAGLAAIGWGIYRFRQRRLNSVALAILSYICHNILDTIRALKAVW